jgi:glucose/arabinose dehydrogenase
MTLTRSRPDGPGRRRAFRPAPEVLEDRLTPTTLPAGFAEVLIASGLAGPTAMELAPDGRLFVAEQGGNLRVVRNGTLLPTPFVSLNVNSAGERGLLGVALDPNFATNQFVYVYYTTATSPLHNRVSRFTANGDVALAGSEVPILDLDNLSSAVIHNGGAIHFGTDGKLYVAVGDNANGSNSQTLSNRLGKVLRVNPDGTIPTDNPYYNTATGLNRAIWALGLRNPFTFAVQPGTGRIFINDVGQNTWEEINDGLAGSNYGWPATEGPTSDPAYRSPLFAYDHSQGCAISGGAFYNPVTAQFPAEYAGKYFFTDFCGGWIRRLDPATGAVSGFASGLASFPVDLKVDAAGSLYYISRGTGATTGAVYRVDYPANRVPPSLTQQPVSRTVAVGQPATFTVSATGTLPLSYQWQRNGSNLNGATGTSYTLASATLADTGARFRCVVTNAFGSVVSSEAVLTVSTSQAPTATITAPTAGTLYSGGMIINYAGTGTDAEDGTLPAGAFTWQVDFHHADHFHPFLLPTSGSTAGSFTIPTTGETAADVWYRIYLTVTDSAGLSHTVFRDVLPRTVTLTLATSPAGLQVTLDGQPQPAPLTVTGVVGIVRTLGVVSPQALAGVGYAFVSWSDGGAATHTIATPAVNTTYTATFAPASQLRFSAPAYSVTEYGGTATVTVVRTGALTETVTVRYATANGTATAGSDYTAASGILTFSPGETSKTFTVAVLEDSLAEGTETVTLTLSSPTGGATLAEPGAAVLSIVDNDAPNARWVVQAYLDLFQRSADASGLGYWTSLLDQGFSRPQVALALTTSSEYRTLLVQGLYTSLLRRPADPGGLSFFVNQLGAGATIDQVKAFILGSQEYYQNRGSGTAAGFLAALYSDVLGRGVDPDGQKYFLPLLETGFSRGSVALTVLRSPEGLQKLVQGFYQQYLRRPADSGGLGYFANLLRSGFREELVLAVIIGSDEYAGRL